MLGEDDQLEIGWEDLRGTVADLKRKLANADAAWPSFSDIGVRSAEQTTGRSRGRGTICST
jgi:hypothetical protein